MKYIRLFETEAEYSAATLDYPNVAYISATDRVAMEKDAPPTPIPNYLQFTAVNGAATIGLFVDNMSPNVSYSFDTETWTSWDYSNITIPSGSTVYMKGNNPNGFIASDTSSAYFTMSGTVEAHGNIMSLIYNDNFEGQLTIPSNFCYFGLFDGCTGLTSAPELPATTLTEYCYYSMFRGCTSLATAPQLPATTLTEWCYGDMFNGCTSLNYIKMMATDISASSCLDSWVRNVAATGTFVKNSAAQWDVSGEDGVPEGWTVQTASS